MGWFQPGGAANRWARRPALEWFRATAEDVTLGPRSVRPVEFVDGWLVEVGRDDLGCQEIWDGGSIRGDEYHFFKFKSLIQVYRPSQAIGLATRIDACTKGTTRS